MSQSVHVQPESRNFFCDHCGGEISVPRDLPPTTAPCPFCAADITSPPPPVIESPAPELVEESVAEPEEKVVPDVPEEPRDEASVPAAEELPSVTPPESSATIPSPPSDAEPLSEEPVAAEQPASAPKSTEPPVVAEVVVDDLAAAKESGPQAKAPVAMTPDRDQALIEPDAGRRGALDKTQRVRLMERAAPDAEVTVEEDDPPKNSKPAVLFLLAALGLAALVMVGVYILQSGVNSDSGSTGGVEDSRFVRDGWKSVATERLRKFLAAETIEEKAKHVIGGTAKLAVMKDFYANVSLDETEMPLEAFSHHSLDLEVREAGIFLMRYERPAQFDMREFFRPVAPLEVQYRLEEPDLLLAGVAEGSNFEMDYTQTMAFFRRAGDDLFVDWDTYVQTKHRTLRDFISMPAPGEKQVFRVLIQEDIADLLSKDGEAMRHYRLTDPGHLADYAKVSVKATSELGRILAELNWIGMEKEKVPTRPATVELVWEGEEHPRIALNRLVCWEFLGLGGKEGNVVVPQLPREAGQQLPPAVPVVDEGEGPEAGDGGAGSAGS